MSDSRPFTLLVQDMGAELWDPEGMRLARLDRPGPEGETPGSLALGGLLPPRARVQIIFADTRVGLHCQDVPSLSRRERVDVTRRFCGAPEAQEALNTAHVLEVDPLAEGGHVLWLASHPRRDLDEWLEALRTTGARAVFAMPWQRAFLDATPGPQAEAAFLALLPGACHLAVIRGRSLAYARVFPLPPRLGFEDGAGVQEFCASAAEEVSRLLQFLRLKHRGTALTVLHTVGLPEVPALAAMAGAQGLALSSLAEDLPAFLLAGVERERRGKSGLDLLPREFREASRRRLFRAVVWTTALGLMVIAPGTWLMLARHEAALEREAVRAAEARDARLALAEEGRQAVRLRFGFLRLRSAEERQARATECLEGLGLRILHPPKGVRLRKAEILQVPGNARGNRFSVEGEALTRSTFSVGCLAAYHRSLTAHPGTKLEPLREVKILDGEAGGLETEKALTRFRLEGSAP